MSDKMEEILKSFYDISSYGEWCDDDDDEDGYYCKELIDNLHELLNETIEVINELLDEELDPDKLFKKLSEELRIDNFSSLYWEIMDTNLEMEYGRVLLYEGIDGYDLVAQVESMLTTLASIDVEEDDE